MDFLKTLFFSVGLVISGLVLFVMVLLMLYVSYVLAMGIGLILAVIITFRVARSLRNQDLPE